MKYRTETLEIKHTVKLSEQRIVDTLINALEGGADYWIRTYTFNNSVDIVEALNIVLNGDGVLTIQEDDRDAATYKVTGDAFKKAVQSMATLYPWHFENLHQENDDAETADVLLQLATFGRIIYG